MSKPKSPKTKMATIRDVYDRILWDNRLARRAFSLGFSDRISGNIREKPLSEWAVDGDIPWHRIRYVKCGETIVWDRDRLIDLFSSGELPGAAWVVATGNEELGNQQEQISPQVLPPTSVTDFQTRAIYQYNQENWQPIDNALESVTITRLKIASFNVLSDRYESERTQTAKRIPVIIEHLRQCDADIIALQEVTPRLLEILLAEDWVKFYNISESPKGETLEWHGLLLLSRLPLILVEYRYSQRKRVLVGKWLLNGKPLNVAVVHFTSDYNKNAIAVRSKQLAILLEYLKTQPGDSLIIGDFNLKGNEQAEILTQNNFIDIWQTLHPDDAGDTFDIQRNPLAAMMSLTGLSARLDRMMLKSQEPDWISHQIELFACEAIPDTEGKIYPSDHFGILTRLESITSLQTIPPIYQSALVIIPPDEILPEIQTIRRICDRQFHRWMPHINILYGFLPEAYFPQVAAAIAQKLTKLQPFTITLSKIETFTHHTSCTAWLNPIPQPPDALHQLQTILQQLFPQCNQQSTRSHNGFTPHLTIGQFPTTKEAQTQLPQWQPINFKVDSIYLISRRHDEPFKIRYSIPLKQENQSETLIKNPPEEASCPSLIQIINKIEPKLNQQQQEKRELIESLIAQACRECLGYPPLLYQMGSARLGVESTQSDLDLICIINTPLAGENFLKEVQERLEGLCDRAQLVKSAIVPVLRMEIEGVNVDLLSAQTLANYDKITPLSGAARPFFDNISWAGVVGCLEVDLMMDIVSKYIPLELFQDLVRAVRAWAKARQIHGNSWGFLGNFSWALLTAWSCINLTPPAPLPWQGRGENLSSLIYSPLRTGLRPAMLTCRFANAGEGLGERSNIDILLANFFQILSQHDWHQPIALTEVGRQYRLKKSREYLPIITSIEPCQNSTRNVTKSTAEILRREFERGAKIAKQVLEGKTNWLPLFEPIDLAEESDLFLVLTVTSEDNDNLEKSRGWLKGHIIGLAINLEQKLNINARIWNKSQAWTNLDCIAVNLTGYVDEDYPVITEIGNEFITQFNTDNYNSSILKIELCDGNASLWHRAYLIV
ncbi:poly(A) polymerase [Limnofasciculus baicalensis]|uniref:RNA repair domain-containing protein n=1 Tax=Limnofasciculus baicalensis BBK-W-15 TaxID=2699891 RepID=A0AAE3GXM8_9CYAN|nr:poly(A) polymerase [Limnofasciculus baicalensis]MCP2731753.1 RNA repair domain-containing protein [Limnofasciculus baicalensis BBK-W-15]